MSSNKQGRNTEEKVIFINDSVDLIFYTDIVLLIAIAIQLLS